MKILRSRDAMNRRLIVKSAVLGLIALTTSYSCASFESNDPDVPQRPALYLARPQFSDLDASGGMRCETPIAPQCHPTTSDRQRSSAPAGREPDRRIVAAQGINTKQLKGTVLLALTRAGQRVFAVGAHGIILLSDDNGASWRQAKVPVSVSLTDVYFITPKKGWAVGHDGVMLLTIDGGASWSKQLTAAAQDEDLPDHVFFDVYFSDEARGFAVGAYGLFLASMDGGNTWLPWQGNIDNPKERHLYCIRAIGSMLYIVGEQGSVFRSSNGGKTFSRLNTPYSGSYFGILGDTSDNLIIFGLGGHAYRSNDAGNHWQRIQITSPAALTAGVVLSDGSFVLGSQTGAVLRSVDHGSTFQLLPVQASFPITGIVQADEDHFLLSGMQGVVRVTATLK